MSVYWTRASHPDLPDVVLPAAAMESYPEWEAIGEPSTDVDALRAELEREQVAARMEALIAASAPAPVEPSPAPEPAAPEFDPEPESPTPSGADPKEQ
jgi:hypothetical protein